MRKRKKSATTAGPRTWRWFVLAALPAVLFLLPKMQLDLWFDEQFTINEFVSKSAYYIATNYTHPNNHILFSLLLRPFYLFSDVEMVLRLPSLLFSCLTLYFAFRTAHQQMSLAAGVASTTLLGLTQFFLNYAIQVRGYSFSMGVITCLLSIAIVPAGLSAMKRGTWIVFLSAAALYALPTNILFLLPLSAIAVAWMVFESNHNRVLAAIKESVWWLGGALLGIACYLPVWSQVTASARTVDAPLSSAWHLLTDFYDMATRDFGFLFAAAITVGLAAVITRRDSKAIKLLIVCVVCLITPFLIAAILAVKPYPRNFTPALPFLALLLGVLTSAFIDTLMDLFKPDRPPSLSALAVWALVLVFCFPTVWTFDARLDDHRTERKPHDDYYHYFVARFEPSKVATYLANRIVAEEQNYILCFTDTDQMQIGFYLERVGLPYMRTKTDARQGAEAFVYLVASGDPEYEALAAKCGVPVERLGRYERLRKFHDFSVYCSDSPEQIQVAR